MQGTSQGTGCALKRAQGTSWAQVRKSTCALVTPSFTFLFLIKGTREQVNKRLGENAKRAEIGSYTPLRRPRNAISAKCKPLVPCALLDFRGALA
jgi:hypothetical protein